MPVKILEQIYENPLEAVPDNTTNWELGNVGDWHKLTLKCEFEVAIDFGIQNTITIQDPNILKLNDGTNWGDWGFYVGAIFDVDYDVYNIASGTTSSNHWDSIIITAMYGDTIEVADYNPSNGSITPFTTLGYAYGQIAPIRTADEEIRSFRISSAQLMQGIKLDIAHIKNSQAQSGSLNNVLDGTRASYVAEDTDDFTTKYAIATRNEVDHYLTPFQSGMAIDRVDVIYRGSQGFKSLYDIEVFYMLAPFGDLLNFTNNDAPDEVKGQESITTQIQVVGYPVYNNPNVQISSDVKKYQQDGNVGWFNENFNQLPNRWSFDPVVYTQLDGTIVSQIDYTNPTVMTTTVRGTGFTPVAGQTRIQYGFIWNPQEEDYYKRTNYPAHKNRKVNTGGSGYLLNDWFPVTAAPVVNDPFPLLREGYSISGVTDQQSILFAANDAKMDASDIIVQQNGNDIDISVTFRPNAAFAAFIDSLGENERSYALWISVGDQSPIANKSDRVSLLVDTNVLDTYIAPIGAYEGMTIDFLDHPQAYTDVPVACGNSMFVEDDLLAKISFQEETDLTIPDTPEITGITFGFLVENTTTGQQYILDATDVDLTQYPDPTQYNYDAIRGFKLGTGNSKNWVKVDYDATNDSGTKKGVLGWYGFKIRWEDWLKRTPNPPTDFYDNAEKQNGWNNDWYHYYSTSGWNFYFYVDLTAQLNGETVKYQNLKQVTIKDYDSNADVDVTFKFYRDNNGVKGAQLIGGTDPISGTPLGVIIKNQYVWYDIEFEWVGVGSPPTDWASQAAVDANVYATECFEVDGGAGQKSFRQLSSIWAPEFDNPIEGIPNETLATVTQVSTTLIRVEGRINGNKIIDAPRYKVSGRIGCK